MADVTVVDYGRGNLFSVGRSLEHCGAEIELTDSPSRIKKAERLLLPGVGAFGDAIEELHRRELVEPLREFAANGRPFLGICVGLQLMFDVSEEFGEHAGLGLIPGRVSPIPRTGVNGQPHKIPHIGWSELVPSSSDTSWEGTILEGVDDPGYCYFVHTYTAVPAEEGHRLADSSYDGCRIAAAVRRDNLWGCQFHPEKSAATGLGILRKFLELSMTDSTARSRVQ